MESLSFANFMQEWLYGEGGYYKKARVGKCGDFYTSVSVGRFFGYCIGFYLSGILSGKKGRAAIVEIGAEKGDLIADIAEFFTLFENGLNCDFVTLEPFVSLQELQKERFKSRLGRELVCVGDFRILREKNYDFVIFVNNELLDAFPCELVCGDKMAFVKKVESKFYLEFQKASDEVLKVAKRLNLQKSEIPLSAFSFINSLASVAREWLFLGFDYGSLESRGEFSLRLYNNHKVESLFDKAQCRAELLECFKKTDLTYDVNFSLWRAAFLRAGAKEIFLKHQNRALVDMGLDKACELYIEKFGLESYMKHTSKIRHLISPGGFGERFFGFCYGVVES
ncbi:MAG: SAM-dependent methyltransferase [Helicobacter sp.]|nr:SAM-dependent methyltransferase [Helicobacteraceae bacterium]MDY3113322.1 SAM-dependent methyltransferase [Helicobacter sp.]